MFEHDLTLEKAYHFARFDGDHLLSTASDHPILLEAQTWRTVEHYYQAHIAGSPKWVAAIADAKSAKDAYAINKPWYRFHKKGWRSERRVLMTRALYTKVQMYPEVLQALMETEELMVIETSAYDHYWGIGRDQRGDNMLGKIWMDIRRKMTEKNSESQAPS